MRKRKWPEGRIGGDDDGEVEVAIAADLKHAVVRIAFPHPVTWLGLSPELARRLARSLLAKADEVEGGRALS